MTTVKNNQLSDQSGQNDHVRAEWRALDQHAMDTGDSTFWQERSTISLSPVAAPSILGWFGSAVTAFTVSANLAGWYGNGALTPLVLSPLVFSFGGIAQLLAAMWAYRARDGLATGIHGAWGSFWMAYGIYALLAGLGVAPPVALSADARVAFGYWFIGLAAVTWTCFAAGLANSVSTSLVLLALAVASTLLAVGWTTDVSLLGTIGAIFLFVSAIAAWYTASAMTMAAVGGRAVLPLGHRGALNEPTEAATVGIAYPVGEPGIKIGQ